MGLCLFPPHFRTNKAGGNTRPQKTGKAQPACLKPGPRTTNTINATAFLVLSARLEESTQNCRHAEYEFGILCLCTDSCDHKSRWSPADVEQMSGLGTYSRVVQLCVHVKVVWDSEERVAAGQIVDRTLWSL